MNFIGFQSDGRNMLQFHSFPTGLTITSDTGNLVTKKSWDAPSNVTTLGAMPCAFAAWAVLGRCGCGHVRWGVVDKLVGLWLAKVDYSKSDPSFSKKVKVWYMFKHVLKFGTSSKSVFAWNHSSATGRFPDFAAALMMVV